MEFMVKLVKPARGFERGSGEKAGSSLNWEAGMGLERMGRCECIC